MSNDLLHYTITGFLVFILFFLIGGVGGFIFMTQQHASQGVLSERDAQPRSPSITSPPLSGTPAPTMTFAPPRESLTGVITKAEGDVGILKRFTSEYASVGVDDNFVIGESMRTLSDTQATLIFEDFGSLTFGEQSHIASISLLPSNFTVEQTKGQIAYAAEDPERPISVRYGGSIIKITGTSVVSIDIEEGIAEVTVARENTTLALLDSSNNTKVRTADTGDRAIIDTVAQTIEIEEPEKEEEEDEEDEDPDEKDDTEETEEVSVQIKDRKTN